MFLCRGANPLRVESVARPLQNLFNQVDFPASAATIPVVRTTRPPWPPGPSPETLQHPHFSGRPLLGLCATQDDAGCSVAEIMEAAA
jgi:hypothetical protein